MKPRHPIFIALAFRRKCKKLPPLIIPAPIKEAAKNYGIFIKPQFRGGFKGDNI